MGRKVDAIIIHCSDSPDARGDIDADVIEQWHRERAQNEPWSFFTVLGEKKYIGYHYVVTKNGEAQAARPVDEVGCHCAGYNKSSIGICWIGRSQMTDKQKETLVFLVAQMCVLYGLEPHDVYGHNHFNPKKTCPNFSSKFTFESIDVLRQQVDFQIREMK